MSKADPSERGRKARVQRDFDHWTRLEKRRETVRQASKFARARLKKSSRSCRIAALNHSISAGFYVPFCRFAVISLANRNHYCYKVKDERRHSASTCR